MIIALNLFDVIPGKEALYADYLRRVEPILERHHARVLFYGRTRARFMGTCSQEYCGIIAYPTPEDLCGFSKDPDFAEIRPLRDNSTQNYVLTVAEDMGLAEAIRELVERPHPKQGDS